MPYSMKDHIEHLKREREEFYRNYSPVHMCCWHSLIPGRTDKRWVCCQCPKRVREQWMDFIDYFQRIGEVRS